MQRQWPVWLKIVKSIQQEVQWTVKKDISPMIHYSNFSKDKLSAFVCTLSAQMYLSYDLTFWKKKIAVTGNMGKEGSIDSNKYLDSTNKIKLLLLLQNEITPCLIWLRELCQTLQFAAKTALTSAFSTAVSVWSSNEHFTAACGIFNTGPPLMKETRVAEWWRKSAVKDTGFSSAIHLIF